MLPQLDVQFACVFTFVTVDVNLVFHFYINFQIFVIGLSVAVKCFLIDCGIVTVVAFKQAFGDRTSMILFYM